MIDIRHSGAAPVDIEKDFDAAALLRTHCPGSQAPEKGVRFRADGGPRRGRGVRTLTPPRLAPTGLAVSGSRGRTASAYSAGKSATPTAMVLACWPCVRPRNIPHLPPSIDWLTNID